MPAQIHLPDDVASSSSVVIEASNELHSLMLGPVGFLLHQIDSPHNLISLYVISHFQIASSFPVHATTTFVETARKYQLDEDETRRILRHAITNHIFNETEDGVLTHTAASKALVQVPLLREWLEQACDDMWPATSRFVDAMIKWPASEEPYQTAFNIASNTHNSYFDEIAKSTTRGQKFADAMSFFSTMPGFEISRLINAYDWASFNDGVVVDLGGSTGTFAVELINAFPHIHVVVQDLPEVINNALMTGKTTASGRITFEVQNFFTKQTRKDADVYFLRMVVHDWPDEYCIRVLKNLTAAFKPNAKILINDFCLPEPGRVSQYRERIARCHDLAMKAVLNAKERDSNAWIKLFSKADPRFKIARIEPLEGSPLSLIDVDWNDTR